MIIRQSFLYLLARLIPGLINFSALAIYTRLLSPEQYGEYSLLLAMISFLQMLLFNWLNLSVLRFMPRYTESPHTLLATLLAAYGTISVLSLLIAFITWVFMPVSLDARLIVFACILLGVWSFFELNLQLKNSGFKALHYSGMTLLKAIMAISIGTFLAWKGWGAEGIILGLIVGNFIPVLLFCRQTWPKISRRQIDKKILWKMLRYGLPLTASALLTEVIHSSDRFFLLWFDGVVSVGQYAVAYDLPRFSLVMLMTSLNLVMYPLLVKAIEDGEENLVHHYSRAHALLLFGIALPATAGLIMLTPNIVSLFIGNEFQQSSMQLLPLIAFAILIAGIKSYYFDLAFQLGEHTQGQVYILLVAAACNLLLNFLLIPDLGMLGAAWATLLTYMLALVLSAVSGQRWFKIALPWRDWFLILLATLGMLLALIPLYAMQGAGWLMLQILLGIVVYGSLLVAFNVGEVRTLLPSSLPFIYR